MQIYINSDPHTRVFNHESCKIFRSSTQIFSISKLKETIFPGRRSAIKNVSFKAFNVSFNLLKIINSLSKTSNHEIALIVLVFRLLLCL